MAKVKGMAATNYVGKLGPAIFYMRGGENINRAVAAQVRNPRTIKQMTRRVMLANLVNLYKANKSWMEKLAFEGRKANLSVYNEFIKANLNSAKIPLTKEEVNEGNAWFQPNLVFTRGSLQRINVTHDDASFNFLTSLACGLGTDLSNQTLGSISADIIASNDGWNEGDQLSIIVMARDFYGYLWVKASELVLDSSNSTPYSSSDIALALTAIQYDGDDYYGFDEISIGSLFPSIDYEVANNDCAILFIHSRTVSGQTSVSDGLITLNQHATDILPALYSTRRLERAIASYGETEEPFLEAGYQTSNSEPTEQATLTIRPPYGGAITVNGSAASGSVNVPVGEAASLGWSAGGETGLSFSGWTINGVDMGISNPLSFTPAEAGEYIVVADIDQTE